MVCPRVHFKRTNYCKDNFCQIRKTVNLILTKFLYFFDSQNNVFAKSNFLTFCFTCSSQNLILRKSKKYVIFPSRNRKILSPQKFIPIACRTVCYGTHSPSPPLPHYLPLTDCSKQTTRRFPYFRFFCCDFFPQCT